MPTEADTCRTYVAPRLYAAGWKDDQIAAHFGGPERLREAVAELQTLLYAA